MGTTKTILKYWNKYNPEIDRFTQSDENKIVNQLTKYAKKFLREQYDLDFNLPILINGRYKNKLACLRCSRNYYLNDLKAVSISMSKQFIIASHFDSNIKRRNEIITKIFQHELIHYACFMNGWEYRDGTPTFERELSRLNVPSSGSTSMKKNVSANMIKYYSIEDLYSYGIGRHTKNNRGCIGTHIALYETFR